MILLPGGPRVFGERVTFTVFTGQKALGQGRKDGDSDAVLSAGVDQVVFDVSVDHVVLGLQYGDGMKVVAFDDFFCFLNPGTAPLLAHAVIEDLAHGNQIAHGPERLLQRGGFIKTVTKIEV